MTWDIIFWLVAILFSVFWGMYGYNYELKKDKNNKNERIGAFVSEFIGSLVGWYCLYIFTIHQKSPSPYQNTGTLDIFLIIGAFLGMAGYSFEIIKLIRIWLKL